MKQIWCQRCQCWPNTLIGLCSKRFWAPRRYLSWCWYRQKLNFTRYSRLLENWKWQISGSNEPNLTLMVPELIQCTPRIMYRVFWDHPGWYLDQHTMISFFPSFTRWTTSKIKNGVKAGLVFSNLLGNYQRVGEVMYDVDHLVRSRKKVPH